MKTNFFKPKNPVLQQYIEGYYFLTHTNSDEPVTYYTFPSNFNIVSLHENVELIFGENAVRVQEKQGSRFVCTLICNFRKPIRISYSGNINEITMSFKPLGLNAFLERPLQTYTNDFFSEFAPCPSFQKVFISILNQENLEEKRERIENYWLSRLTGFQHPFLEEAVNDLVKDAKEYSIAELALKHQTSRQNLTKQFELHLCKSPSLFKKIHRFRAALQLNLIKTPKETLTTMGYDLLFYDQSHLTKDFKSLTGFTPKMFFKNVSQLEEGKINWVFS